MRDAMTYRSARRNEWRKYRELNDGVAGAIQTWGEYNPEAYGTSGYSIKERYFPPKVTMRSWVARSKYMPHIGKKERARHAPA